VTSTTTYEVSPEFWPSLPLNEWKDTYDTLHMWTQVVGKIRLALAPPVNHWWHTTLYISARGLTTSAMPYRGRLLEIEFDFLDHKLHLKTSNKVTRSLELTAQPVADFYRAVMNALESAGFEISIFTKPQEVANPIPFEQDREHASYDPEYANRFWRILVQTAEVFEKFRGRFIGKSSPVHFFWGSFDLAITRFSGKPAPERPGADLITREAYSHECISAGFWPGAGLGAPAFYSYTAPAPPGLESATIQPGFYSNDLSEFLLMYDDVRSAPSPHDALLGFLQTTYDAGAQLGGWDRNLLERQQ